MIVADAGTPINVRFISGAAAVSSSDSLSIALSPLVVDVEGEDVANVVLDEDVGRFRTSSFLQCCTSSPKLLFNSE
jgi:hypothetical protein